jgi:hypothetical protein
MTMGRRKKVIIGIILLVIISATAVFAYTSSSNSKEESRPEDFVQVKRDMEKGIYFGMCDLSPEYYTAPEFYPSYKMYQEKQQNKKHDYTRWGVHGYGAYPGEIGYTVKDLKAGQTLNTCTYVRSAWEIETYRGIRIHGDSEGGVFEVKVDPESFMLTPTFPIISNGWVKKVNVTLIANQDVNQGTYNVTFAVVRPELRDEEQFYRDMKALKQEWYNCPYVGNCSTEIVELRKRTYMNEGTIAADKFFKISIKVI